MTAIAGLHTEEGTWLAADGRSTFSDRAISSETRVKLHAFGPWSIASTGPARLCNLIAREGARLFPMLNPYPEIPLSAQVDGIADALREMVKADGWPILTGNEGSPPAWDLSFVLGHPGGLWVMTGDLTASKQTMIGFGSGGDYASGALEALRDLQVEPAEAVGRAVEIAIRRDSGCGGRILCHELRVGAETARVSVWGEQGRSRNPVRLAWPDDYHGASTDA